MVSDTVHVHFLYIVCFIHTFCWSFSIVQEEAVFIDPSYGRAYLPQNTLADILKGSFVKELTIL